MVTVILLVLLLFVVQTFLPSSIRYLGRSPGESVKIALGPRDQQPPLSVMGERAARALANLHEALPVFLALALLSLVLHVQTGNALLGAWIFLIARVLYVPAYLSGIPGVRSLVWMAGHGGLIVMLLPVLAAAH